MWMEGEGERGQAQGFKGLPGSDAGKPSAPYVNTREAASRSSRVGPDPEERLANNTKDSAARSRANE